MEKQMKKLAMFGLLLALSLTLSLPLSAQRGGSRGGGSHGGGSRMHAGGGYSGAASRSTASFFLPRYSSYYLPNYGFVMPLGYTNPYLDSENVGPAVIMSPPLVPDAGPSVVYVPYYLRPNTGPSLAEIAAQLKAERQPAKYIWRNVEPLLQPKEDQPR
jgi:hypothetical protein